MALNVLLGCDISPSPAAYISSFPCPASYLYLLLLSFSPAIMCSSVTEYATIPILKQFTCGAHKKMGQNLIEDQESGEEEAELFECAHGCGFQASHSEVCHEFARVSTRVVFVTA